MSSTEFSKIKLATRYWLYGKDYYTAVKAMEYAAKHHTGMRKDGVTPEFHHQLSIASYIRTLPNLLFPERALAVAFLHDVVEDYNISLSEIERRFTKDIAYSVRLMSKKVEGYEAKTESYYASMIEDPVSSIVKGSDRIHNFQTMPEVFTTEKQMKYIDECEKYIIPMLKEARRKFPEQEPAYENIKHVLLSQIGLIKISLKYKEQQGGTAELFDGNR